MSRGIRAASAVVLVAVLAGLAGCIPANRNERPGWALPFGSANAVNNTGSDPRVIYVGDSLVFNSDVTSYVNLTRFYTGKNSFAIAVPAASYTHFVTPGLISGLAFTIQGYVDYFAASRQLMVIALGTNDARILGAERDLAGGYRIGDFQASVNTAITKAQEKSRCVVLVNASTRNITGSADYRNQATAVNAYLAQKVAESAGRVRLANWNSASSAHPEWFEPNDIHHSAVGKTKYRDFVTGAAGAALDAGC
jgi:hypothetical protein